MLMVCFSHGQTAEDRVRGALYYVTSWGDGREAVFEDDGDREGFLHLLGEDEGDRGLILASTIPR